MATHSSILAWNQQGRFSFKRDFLTSDTVLKAGGVLYYFR